MSRESLLPISEIAMTPSVIGCDCPVDLQASVLSYLLRDLQTTLVNSLEFAEFPLKCR